MIDGAVRQKSMQDRAVGLTDHPFLCRASASSAATAASSPALVWTANRRGPVAAVAVIVVVGSAAVLALGVVSARHARGRRRRHPQLLLGPRGAPLPMEDALPQHVHRRRGHLRREGQGRSFFDAVGRDPTMSI